MLTKARWETFLNSLEWKAMAEEINLYIEQTRDMLEMPEHGRVIPEGWGAPVSDAELRGGIYQLRQILRLPVIFMEDAALEEEIK